MAFATISVATQATAQSGGNLLVVANSEVPESVEIADYYAAKRSLPAGQVLRLKITKGNEIPHPSYAAQIERPIAEWLAAHGAYDRILYIVLTKGVPLRIAGTVGASGTTASVDSELSLLYRKLLKVPIRLSGPEKNPYFLDQAAIASAKPFTHKDHDIFLVARLDGFTIADVKALIDRGASPSQNGVILLDRRFELKPTPTNDFLKRAADAIEKVEPGRQRAVLNSGIVNRTEERPVLGYYSWGANDRSSKVGRAPQVHFSPGAIGGMFVSGDARTMQTPPDTWRPGVNEFAGSKQSLTGDLIRGGITGVAGQVAEAFLESAVRPQVLFPAYLSGFNLIESFYLAMPAVSWQTVVIGDPLAAPFRRQPPAGTELDPPLDSVSGLPQFFSDRRVALMTRDGGTREAGRYFLKADLRLGDKDVRGAIEALETATKVDPTFDAAHLTLGLLYDSVDRFDDAVERYRRVIQLKPNHITALNNLAYDLAERLKRPVEALPLARRAYVLAPKTPNIVDTLGWTYHLLGDNDAAEPLLLGAAKAAPKSPEILLHAATVLAAKGNRSRAVQLLDGAIATSPELARRQDVRELRDRLKSPAR